MSLLDGFAIIDVSGGLAPFGSFCALCILLVSDELADGLGAVGMRED